MSGSFLSTGMWTNKGKKLSEKEIEKILDLKIIELSIQIIPLKQNSGFTLFRCLGKLAQDFIHPAILSPTLSHIAIQLTLERDYIVIIEYGQYYSKESIKKNTSIFASCSDGSNSSQNPRSEFNNLIYYYINKDGVRLTIIPIRIIFSLFIINLFETNLLRIARDQRGKISLYSLLFMACNHYKIPYVKFINNIDKLSSISDYNFVECNIKNKISLRELCNKFKGEKWEAKSYNITSHNCQDFGAEVINILKAIRIHDIDKIRSREKQLLPNCIISALWDNEELSGINTIGRIPIIGLGFDYFASPFIHFSNNKNFCYLAKIEISNDE